MVERYEQCSTRIRGARRSPRAPPGRGACRTPLREFLRTETGGAAVLLAAAVAALVWVNVDASSYDSLWGTTLSVELGDAGISLDLREWVNSGLMTFFSSSSASRRGASSIWVSCANGGVSCCRCSRRSPEWASRSRSTSPSTPGTRPRRAGDCDVDRHGVCAGAARPRRPALPDRVARVHADRGDRRRHRRARRHRDRPQRGAEPGSSAGRRCVLRRRGRRSPPSDPPRPRLFRPGPRRLGCSTRIGRGADRHRTRARTPCLRLPGPARNPGARD